MPILWSLMGFNPFSLLYKEPLRAPQHTHLSILYFHSPSFSSNGVQRGKEKKERKNFFETGSFSLSFSWRDVVNFPHLIMGDTERRREGGRDLVALLYSFWAFSQQRHKPEMGSFDVDSVKNEERNSIWLICFSLALHVL